MARFLNAVFRADYGDCGQKSDDRSWPQAIGRWCRCAHQARAGLALYGSPLRADFVPVGCRWVTTEEKRLHPVPVTSNRLTSRSTRGRERRCQSRVACVSDHTRISLSRDWQPRYKTLKKHFRTWFKAKWSGSQ